MVEHRVGARRVEVERSNEDHMEARIGADRGELQVRPEAGRLRERAEPPAGLPLKGVKS